MVFKTAWAAELLTKKAHRANSMGFAWCQKVKKKLKLMPARRRVTPLAELATTQATLVGNLVCFELG
jgi:hypothetical protein